MPSDSHISIHTVQRKQAVGVYKTLMAERQTARETEGEEREGLESPGGRGRVRGGREREREDE